MMQPTKRYKKMFASLSWLFDCHHSIPHGYTAENGGVQYLAVINLGCVTTWWKILNQTMMHEIKWLVCIVSIIKECDNEKALSFDNEICNWESKVCQIHLGLWPYDVPIKCNESEPASGWQLLQSTIHCICLPSWGLQKQTLSSTSILTMPLHLLVPWTTKKCLVAFNIPELYSTWPHLTWSSFPMAITSLLLSSQNCIHHLIYSALKSAQLSVCLTF